MGPDSIHLWLTNPDTIDEKLDLAYFSLLSAEEKQAQQRFVFKKDRRRYLVTRALVRTILSRYKRIAPADWAFTRNQYGCPRIADNVNPEAHIHFNLSHTQGMIVLAVTKARAVGVDVENTQICDISIDIADRFFAPNEVKVLRGTQENYQKDRFFEYWTFKESYIKARGMGLSIPLDQFSFELSRPGAVSFQVASDLGDSASRWCFWQFRPSPDHIVALCAEYAPIVSVMQTIPLLWDKQLKLSSTRSSINESYDTQCNIG